MRVKICAVQNEEEVATAVAAGADAVGFLIGQRFPSQDFILPETAIRLVRLLPPFVTPVLVTHLTEPEAIMELVDQTMITTIQLHGGSTPEQILPLREYLGNSGKLILAVHVKPVPGEYSVDPAQYENLIDAFLLDTMDPDTGKVGGTGKTHNWQSSAMFGQKTRLPVILAGGLNPENVAEAIHTVHPFAVDVNSGLRPVNRMLDPRLAVAFVQNAQTAVTV